MEKARIQKTQEASLFASEERGLKRARRRGFAGMPRGWKGQKNPSDGVRREKEMRREEGLAA